MRQGVAAYDALLAVRAPQRPAGPSADPIPARGRPPPRPPASPKQPLPRAAAAAATAAAAAGKSAFVEALLPSIRAAGHARTQVTGRKAGRSSTPAAHGTSGHPTWPCRLRREGVRARAQAGGLGRAKPAPRALRQTLR